MGAAEKLNHGNEPNRKPENELRLVESNDEMDYVRDEILRVASDSLGQRYISQETYNVYAKLGSKEKKKEAMEKGIDKMQKVLQFASNYHKINEDIAAWFQDGMGKYLSEKDKKYWKENYIDNPGFVMDYGNKRKRLEQLIKNRIGNRKTFDQLTRHPSVKQGKVNLGPLNGMFTVKGFLEAEVPKRKEFLDALDAEIKRVAEKEKEEQKLKAANFKEYKGLLKKERDKRNIGEKTEKAFSKEFPKDIPSQLDWINGLKGQMAPRVALRRQIEKLPPDQRKAMEALREKVGYTELMETYVNLGPTLNKAYMKQLKEYKFQAKDYKLGDHSLESFDAWIISTQSIENKCAAIKQIPAQMKYYEDQQRRATLTLTEKQLDFFNSKNNEWGYTQRAQYLDNPEAYEQDLNLHTAFQCIQSGIARQTMIEMVKYITAQGPTVLKNVHSNLQRMVDGSIEEADSDVDILQKSVSRQRQTFAKKKAEEIKNRNAKNTATPEDALFSFQKDLAEKRQMSVNLNSSNISIDTSTQNQVENVSEQNNSLRMEEDLRLLQKEDQVQVNEEAGFQEFVFADQVGSSEIKIANVVLNTVNGNDWLCKRTIGKGKLSLWTGGQENESLDLQATKAFKEVIEMAMNHNNH